MSAEASRPSADPASTRASSAGVRDEPSSSRRHASIAAAIVPLRDGIAYQPLTLLVGQQRIDDRIELAVENRFQIASRQADPMISEPVLGKVVRANFFAAVARADLRTPRASGLFF